MPLRKSVQSLECLAINQLDTIISSVCLKSASYISDNYYDDKITRHNNNNQLDTVIQEKSSYELT